MNTLTPLTSASQISAFQSCQRAWGFRSLLKIKGPQSPAQLLGIDVDDNQIQPYLTDGRPFDFTRPSGEIAATAIPHIPCPRQAKVQYPILLPALCSEPGKPAPFAYQGYLDVLPIGYDLTYPILIDIKTTVDFKWAKSEAELRQDPQAVIYATWALYTSRAAAVTLRWLYLRTRGRSAAQAVDVVFWADDPELEATMMAFEETAKRIVYLTQTTDRSEGAINLLEPNPAACGKFGGCPYAKKQCQLTAASQVDALFQEREPIAKMGLLSKTAPTTGLLARLVTPPPTPAEVLPAWATAPVDPMTEAVAINPPEQHLTPPATATSAPEPAKRTRATKAEMEARRAAAGAATDNPVADALEDIAEGVYALAKALRASGK